MKKWLAGIAGAIVSGVLVFFLTEAFKTEAPSTLESIRTISPAPSSEPEHAYETSYTVRRSPSLGVQFVQRSQVMPLEYIDRSSSVLKVSLSPVSFQIRFPALTDWVARIKGSPGCPPTDGMHIALSTDRGIYGRMVIGEKTEYTGFFGCIKAIVGTQYGAGDLVLWDQASEGYNFVNDERSETVNGAIKMFHVSRIWKHTDHGLQNVLAPGRRLYAVFYVDIDGDGVVGRNEFEKVSVVFSR